MAPRHHGSAVPRCTNGRILLANCPETPGGVFMRALGWQTFPAPDRGGSRPSPSSPEIPGRFRTPGQQQFGSGSGRFDDATSSASAASVTSPGRAIRKQTGKLLKRREIPLPVLERGDDGRFLPFHHTGSEYEEGTHPKPRVMQQLTRRNTL